MQQIILECSRETLKGPFPTLMHSGRLFLFWKSRYCWMTPLIGQLFLSGFRSGSSRQVVACVVTTDFFVETGNNPLTVLKLKQQSNEQSVIDKLADNVPRMVTKYPQENIYLLWYVIGKYSYVIIQLSWPFALYCVQNQTKNTFVIYYSKDDNTAVDVLFRAVFTITSKSTKLFLAKSDCDWLISISHESTQVINWNYLVKLRMVLFLTSINYKDCKLQTLTTSRGWYYFWHHC